MTGPNLFFDGPRALAGIVLCGGHSSRMGSDKAWLPWGSGTLLQHVVQTMLQFCDPVIVVCAAGQRVPPLPENIIFVEDSVPGQGPMRGLHSGLGVVQRSNDAAFVVACDNPFVTNDFARLLQQVVGDRRAAVVKEGEEWFPLPGLYRTKILTALERKLDAGDYSLRRLLQESNVSAVSTEMLKAAGIDAQVLVNLNTAEEYARAVARIGRASLPASRSYDTSAAQQELRPPMGSN